MDNLLPGQMLGSYRIISQIGEGGMATVYKAYQASMDRNVAIKVLPSQLANQKEFAGRFRQEARIIANLEHPHILPVFDSGESDGVSYLVMRYLEAGTLKEKMESHPLSLNEIDRIFTQLADALSYAHGRGVIHRDLKPSNALIDSQGNLFLTDFGIAKLLENTSHFTKTDTVMGTPAYISPEQAQGQVVDRRSDIYSLGIILYEMVTGRVPYMADTPLAVIYKHVNAPLPLPSTLKPDLPPQIEQVILKALAKSPEDRFDSAAEFITAWKSALSIGETVQSVSGDVEKTMRYEDMNKKAGTVPPTVAMPKPGTSKRPSRGVLIGCLVGICAVFVIGGAAYYVLNRDNFSSGTSDIPPETFSIEVGDEVLEGEPDAGAGVIEEVGAQDVYTFSAEPGGEVFIQFFERDESNGDIAFFLSDEDGFNLISSCLECGVPGLVSLERGGEYTITVGSDNPEDAGYGSYHFKLWEVPSPEEYSIDFDQVVRQDDPDAGAGYIESPGSRDVYTFFAEPGQDVYFQITETPSTSDIIQWNVSDENGDMLFDSCLQCGDPGLITLENGGTYTITVGGGTGVGIGPYAIEVWGVPASDEFEIAIGDTVSTDTPASGAGNIESPGAHDVYRFTVTAGQTVAFTVLDTPDTGDSLQWWLENENGDVLFDVCMECGDPDPVTFDEDGIYTIIVGNDTTAGVGEYSFQIYFP